MRRWDCEHETICGREEVPFRHTLGVRFSNGRAEFVDFCHCWRVWCRVLGVFHGEIHVRYEGAGDGRFGQLENAGG